LTKEEKGYSPWEMELLGIVDSLKKWHCYVENGLPITVLNDHAGLSTIINVKEPTPRQARWLMELQAYPLQVKYTPGSTHIIQPSDCLSRAFVDGEKVTALAAIEAEAGESENTIEKPLTLELDILKKLQAGYTLPVFAELLKDKRNSSWTHSHGLYYHHGRIVVPSDVSLRSMLLNLYHSVPYVGHRGSGLTLKNIERDYYWINMAADVNLYVSTCAVCQKAKLSPTAKQGLLNPIPIPSQRFDVLSMDYMFHLPKTKQGYDGVLVFVDKLTRAVRRSGAS